MCTQNKVHIHRQGATLIFTSLAPMHHNAINKGMLLHKNIETKYELTKQQKPFGKCVWCDYVDYS